MGQQILLLKTQDAFKKCSHSFGPPCICFVFPFHIWHHLKPKYKCSTHGSWWPLETSVPCDMRNVSVWAGNHNFATSVISWTFMFLFGMLHQPDLSLQPHLKEPKPNLWLIVECSITKLCSVAKNNGYRVTKNGTWENLSESVQSYDVHLKFFLRIAE